MTQLRRQLSRQTQRSLTSPSIGYGRHVKCKNDRKEAECLAEDAHVGDDHDHERKEDSETDDSDRVRV